MEASRLACMLAKTMKQRFSESQPKGNNKTNQVFQKNPIIQKSSLSVNGVFKRQSLHVKCSA